MSDWVRFAAHFKVIQDYNLSYPVVNKSPEILFHALFVQVILRVCVQLKLLDSRKRNNDYFYIGGNSL